MVIRYRKHLHLPCQFGFLCGSIQGYPAAKSLRYVARRLPAGDRDTHNFIIGTAPSFF